MYLLRLGSDDGEKAGKKKYKDQAFNQGKIASGKSVLRQNKLLPKGL